MQRISLLYLGAAGAGPVYSLEMADALLASQRCKLQVIISSNIFNIEKWKEKFEGRENVDFHIVDAYKRSPFSVMKSIYFEKSKKERIIHLIQAFKADVLYVPFMLLWGAYIYRRLYKQLRIIFTLHDPHPHDSFIGGFKEFIVRNLVDRNSIRYVHDVVLLNRRDVPFVQSKTGKNILVIPHASFSYYVKNEICDYSIKNVIGFLGRIELYKGLDLLVEAFEKQANYSLKLIIAGSGSIEPSLRSKIEGNSRILLINRYIGDDEFQGLVDQMDFVVLPYKRASQSGVIPMVYAFGKTVIATNVGSLAEQIPSGTGLLVDSNVDALVEGINFFYSHPASIREYGLKAQNYAQTELTWAHSAKLLLDYLEK